MDQQINNSTPKNDPKDDVESLLTPTKSPTSPQQSSVTPVCTRSAQNDFETPPTQQGFNARQRGADIFRSRNNRRRRSIIEPAPDQQSAVANRHIEPSRLVFAPDNVSAPPAFVPPQEDCASNLHTLDPASSHAFAPSRARASVRVRGHPPSRTPAFDPIHAHAPAGLSLADTHPNAIASPALTYDNASPGNSQNQESNVADMCLPEMELNNDSQGESENVDCPGDLPVTPVYILHAEDGDTTPQNQQGENARQFSTHFPGLSIAPVRGQQSAPNPAPGLRDIATASVSRHTLINACAASHVTNARAPSQALYNARATSHPINANATSHPINARATSHPINARATSHPINANATSHHINARATSHLINAHATSHPINAHATSHHHINIQCTSRHINVRASSHLINSHTTSHLVNGRAPCQALINGSVSNQVLVFTNDPGQHRHLRALVCAPPPCVNSSLSVYNNGHQAYPSTLLGNSENQPVPLAVLRDVRFVFDAARDTWVRRRVSHLFWDSRSLKRFRQQNASRRNVVTQGNISAQGTVSTRGFAPAQDNIPTRGNAPAQVQPRRNAATRRDLFASRGQRIIFDDDENSGTSNTGILLPNPLYKNKKATNNKKEKNWQNVNFLYTYIVQLIKKALKKERQTGELFSASKNVFGSEGSRRDDGDDDNSFAGLEKGRS